MIYSGVPLLDISIFNFYIPDVAEEYFQCSFNLTMLDTFYYYFIHDTIGFLDY